MPERLEGQQIRIPGRQLIGPAADSLAARLRPSGDNLLQLEKDLVEIAERERLAWQNCRQSIIGDLATIALTS